MSEVNVMSRLRIPLCRFVLALSIVAVVSNVMARQSPTVKTIQITPATTPAEAGQELKLNATGKDEAGKPVDLKPAAWFAAPFDIASADPSGTITFYHPGEVIVGVVIGGKTEILKIKVKPAPIARVEIESLDAPVAVGGDAKLSATART